MTAPTPLPEAFLERLQQIQLPADLKAVEKSFSSSPWCGFCVNTLNTTVDTVRQWLESRNIPGQSLSWSDEVFKVSANYREALTHSELVTAGAIYILDPASVLIANLLEAQPGEEILDLAAAPGGKTLCLASAMDNRGRIAAVESVKHRFFKLKQNLETGGVRIADCYLKDGRKVGRQVPERFDRVLLDAPCSSESRFDLADPSSYQFWSRKKIADMQRKQKQLLHSALQALKPGGRLVYSTCSYAPEENELVINRQLQLWAGKLEIEQINLPIDNRRPGLTQWEGKTLDQRLQHSHRIIPDGVMKGFYVCVLRKLDG